MEQGLLFVNKNDLAISSRSNDFNIQTSAVNIHSQKWLDRTISLIYVIFHDFMIIILKNNLWSFKQERSKPW